MTTSGRDVKHCIAATQELREAMNATLQARETLSLLVRVGMDDIPKLEVYTKRLNTLEQAERRILDALRRQNRAALSGR